VAVSGKDRGAILLAGKTGTAYMYMDKTGNFASSTYYMKASGWVQQFQAAKPQDRYYGKSWTPLLPEAAYAGDASEDLNAPKPGSHNRLPYTYYSESGKIDAGYYNSLKTGPFLDQLTIDFARAAVEGENLGRNPAGVPDLLGVSLSAHDYVNHAFGPESKLSHDHLQRRGPHAGRLLQLPGQARRHGQRAGGADRRPRLPEHAGVRADAAAWTRSASTATS
jgi:hypothetical protein